MISTVLYLIGKILTFPGAYLKCFFEHLAARAFGIPTEDQPYLRLTDGCGHMEHDNIYGHTKNFFYSWLPGILNFFVGFPFFLAGYSGLFLLRIPMTKETSVMFVVYCLFFFLGFSMCANVFPLFEDAQELWQSVFGKDSKAKLIVKILLAIPCALIYAGALLEKYAVNILIMIAITAACALTIL